MATANDEAMFTFSWLALKLLGRGLYSNPWSALSELVANGFDAGAARVYVYVDAREKSNAIIEVIDDGSGMTRQDISTYVQVGYNKRNETNADHDGRDLQPKGRKGIGKLASLFLSQNFYLSTKSASEFTSWHLDARDDIVKDDENPRLESVAGTPGTPNDGLWESFSSGTRLTMLAVDLTGYGAQSISALGSRLANQFLLPQDASSQILLWVRVTEADIEPKYAPVQKNIAFNNFAAVAQNFRNNTLRPSDLVSPPPVVMIPAPGLPGGMFPHAPTSSGFPDAAPDDEAWDEIKAEVDASARTYREIRYSLEGWIGVHATIKNEIATQNDARFLKNKYYNPAQLRVYVRGKLASEHLLSQLGLTGTYVNYIEGELSFDLLDDDSLDDIATSNRQDFDQTDGRVTLLRALVRPIVRSLIHSRNVLASTIADEVAREKERRETASKRQFSDQLHGDLAQHPEIPEATKNELQLVITNKIQGAIMPKLVYRVFISHAREDKPFAAFIDEALRSKGASPDEIFFSSRTGGTALVMDERALGPVIKEMLVNANTLIFYMTSKNFLKSQFCLFEGGAGWATRAVVEYLKLNVDYDSIPKFLTNGKAEVTLLNSAKDIDLTPEIHNYLVIGVLNPMIEHLNRGRDIAGEPLLDLFKSQDFPTAVEMLRDGKVVQDYYDDGVVENWDALVKTALPTYLVDYLAPKGSTPAP